MQVLPDLAGAIRAFRDRDAAWFAAAGARLGVELALAPLTAYLQRFDEHEREHENLAVMLIQQLYAALASPHGYSFHHFLGHRVFTCLVARGEGQVVLGMQPSFRRTPFPDRGWNVRSWSSAPARNAAAVAAWAREPERSSDAIAFAMIVRALDSTDSIERGRQLLAAVVASPADDSARQVYADWLLERGDVRGELIQLQCELATGALRDPRRPAIRARERELLESRDALLASSLGPITRYALRRGLVDSVTMTPIALAEHGDTLLAAHPIRRARIAIDHPRALAQLDSLQALARIPDLEIVCERQKPRRWKRIAALAHTRAFTATERLAFVNFHSRDDQWHTFLAGLAAPRLRALAFDTHVGHAALELLTRETTLPTVESLHITFGYLPSGSDVVDLFTRLAGRPGLRSLGLIGFTVDEDVMARIVRGVLSRGRALTELRLSQSWSVGRALEIVADALVERRLDCLELDRGFAIDAIAALIRSPGFANLGELVIDSYANDAECDLITDALVASPGQTRVNWRHAGSLGADRIAKILARRDLVYAHDDGSLDLVAGQ